jgi:thiol-disulfide isomerase/thioredoxin
MSRFRIVPALALVSLLFGPTVDAQERPPGRFEELESLNASYEKQLHDLECRRIADLAALARKAAAPEADAALRQLFGLAIARGLCPEAQAAAARCRASTNSGRDVKALAALVQVLAHADRGQHHQAIDDWKALLNAGASASATDQRAGAELALAVGEAYLQRLIRDGRYDVARTWCALACSETAPAEVRDHFEDRKARLDWIGKPAPPISARDVDGKPVSLAELKGKVVLVDFWATWCPPCVAAIPTLDALAQKYRDRGFVILGVNVDAMHEDAQDARKVLPMVRRFLVRHRVTWTNILNGQGTSAIAAAYRVEQIPANFLVDREGRIVDVEQGGDKLEQAVARALGIPSASPSK